MILKSLSIQLCLFVSSLSGKNIEYTYDNLAGGWLKYHKAASWEDASIQCDTEGGVLASPLNSQLRDAIKDYMSRVGHASATIMTGVQNDFSTGDYYSIEGVSLKKMPVTVEGDTSAGAVSCVNWKTSKAAVKYVKCDDKLPFVCYKKRKSWVVAGCGTSDPEYVYNDRSGSCYKFHKKGLTWSKAYAKCKDEGAYLTIINSQLENDVLVNLFDKYPGSVIKAPSPYYAFVGIRDWLDGESWKTIKGQSLSEAGFSEWASGEPNNGHGNEHCGTLYRPGNYNDGDCGYVAAYICEKEPEILYN